MKSQAVELRNAAALSEPASALAALVRSQVEVLQEAARRVELRLPGLEEAIRQHAVISTSQTSRKVYGTSTRSAWVVAEGNGSGRRVHDLNINASWLALPDGSLSTGEQLLVTLLHESLHVYGYVKAIKTTSRQGRYHNGTFAELSARAGLAVESTPVNGWTTPGLSAEGRELFADLVEQLEQAINIAHLPRPLRALDADGQASLASLGEGNRVGPHTQLSKFVYPHCACPGLKAGTFATIRISRSLWHRQIGCIVCGLFFRLDDEPFDSAMSNEPGFDNASSNGTSAALLPRRVLELPMPS